MKSIKLIAAGALALSAAHAAFAYGNAAGHVNITGSTAFRAAANAAIVTAFDAPPKYVYSGASLSGANQAAFIGNIGGHSVIVKTSFQGSLGGVKAVATNTAPLNSPYITDAQANAQAVLGGVSLTGSASSVELADFAMADANAAEAPFATPSSLSSNVVGVIVFKFVAAKGSSASLTNITGLQFQALAGSNTGVPLSFFTGSSTDTKRVYLTGRDDDSGTRLVTFQETGFGVASLPNQFQLIPAGGSGTPTGIQIWPRVAGHPDVTGELGYWGFASGGNVRTELSRDVSGLSGVAAEVGYISESDAAGALTAGAHELTYNGQTFSATNIQEGKYTFWGYENVVIDAAANADAQTVATNVSNAVLGDGFVEGFGVGLSLDRMHVGRSASGQVVTEGSPF